MKEILKQFAAYNEWANQLLLEVILAQPEEKQKAELPSSFTTLYKTVLHMWDAESAWWQRMKLHERLIIPSETFNGSMADIANGLLNQSRQWKEWVAAASDLSLDHVFQYYNSKKESVKMPVFQMLLHVFNHGTYHRGQLVNMCRQLGIEKLPRTDFSFWCSRK
jgi:uncharacterized damage-inducible protein DinB